MGKAPSLPVRDALDYGVKVTGCTVHIADAGVDTGPILRQEAVAIEDTDTEESLHERIKVVERRLLIATLADLALSVYNAAIDLGEFGRLDEAAALAEEAAGHHRALAGRHPGAFAADLGDSLVVWGRLLCDLGRVEAARVRLREALGLFASGARPESVGETRALLDSLTGRGDPA